MSKRLAPIFFSMVIAIAIVGYLVGIMDGVPQASGLHDVPLLGDRASASHDGDPKLIPATAYASIPRVSTGPTDRWQATAKRLPTIDYDLFAAIDPDPAEKEASTRVRASRRAFNGAPPVIPHQVENTTDGACYACHAQGMELEGRKASVMSHPFLTNCTQCHAPPPPKPFREADARVETEFVGLPAPEAGERAYPGAPPTIPHSQWMRQQCTACHGGPHGWAGMETTHPWRGNCTQCHAPSAQLDQGMVARGPAALRPLETTAN